MRDDDRSALTRSGGRALGEVDQAERQEDLGERTDRERVDHRAHAEHAAEREPDEHHGDLQGGAHQAQREPGQDWFSFSPQRFTLAPGASADVAGRLVVPSDAEPGEYFALLKAQTVSPSQAGTSVGVAAATKVTFSIEPSSWFDARRREINRWLDDAAPWTYILPGALLIGFLLTKAGKLPFRLRLERK